MDCQCAREEYRGRDRTWCCWREERLPPGSAGGLRSSGSGWGCSVPCPRPPAFVQKNTEGSKTPNRVEAPTSCCRNRWASTTHLGIRAVRVRVDLPLLLTSHDQHRLDRTHSEVVMILRYNNKTYCPAVAQPAKKIWEAKKLGGGDVWL